MQKCNWDMFISRATPFAASPSSKQLAVLLDLLDAQVRQAAAQLQRQTQEEGLRRLRSLAEQ